MIDLYTALKLCAYEETFILLGAEYTRREIIEKFDLRKTMVKEIYYDRWIEALRFTVHKEE